MVDTTKVEKALTDLAFSITSKEIETFSEFQEAETFFELLTNFSPSFFKPWETDLKNTLESIEKWQIVINTLELYFTENKKTMMFSSEITDLNQGNKAEIINLFFVFINMILDEKNEDWEKLMARIHSKDSKEILNKIRSNIDGNSFESSPIKERESKHDSFIDNDIADKSLLARLDFLEEKLENSKAREKFLEIELYEKKTQICDLEEKLSAKEVEIKKMMEEKSDDFINSKLQIYQGFVADQKHIDTIEELKLRLENNEKLLQENEEKNLKLNEKIFDLQKELKRLKVVEKKYDSFVRSIKKENKFMTRFNRLVNEKKKLEFDVCDLKQKNKVLKKNNSLIQKMMEKSQKQSQKKTLEIMELKNKVSFLFFFEFFE